MGLNADSSNTQHFDTDAHSSAISVAEAIALGATTNNINTAIMHQVGRHGNHPIMWVRLREEASIRQVIFWKQTTGQVEMKRYHGDKHA